MDESTGQLLSTRINNLAGEAAGHNNETLVKQIARLLYLIMVRELRTSGIY